MHTPHTTRKSMNKYPNGYLPKIQYWKSRLDSATNPHDKAQAASKMAYFITRHTSQYGPLDLTQND
jgi:hypothetical protein